MNMKTYLEQFAAFEKAMDEDRIYRDANLDFEGICCHVGADPVVVDGMASREVGCDARTLVEIYREMERWEAK